MNNIKFLEKKENIESTKALEYRKVQGLVGEQSFSIVLPKTYADFFSRTAQVVFTVVACWLASGIVFGFAALKPVLIDVGVYRELCTAEELADDVDVCFEQDLRCVPGADRSPLHKNALADKTSQTQLLLCHRIDNMQRLRPPRWHHPRPLRPPNVRGPGQRLSRGRRAADGVRI